MMCVHACRHLVCLHGVLAQCDCVNSSQVRHVFFCWPNTDCISSPGLHLYAFALWVFKFMHRRGQDGHTSFYLCHQVDTMMQQMSQHVLVTCTSAKATTIPRGFLYLRDLVGNAAMSLSCWPYPATATS